MILATIVIFLENKDAGSTWAWLMVTLLYSDSRVYSIFTFWEKTK